MSINDNCAAYVTAFGKDWSGGSPFPQGDFHKSLSGRLTVSDRGDHGIYSADFVADDGSGTKIQMRSAYSGMQAAPAIICAAG